MKKLFLIISFLIFAPLLYAKGFDFETISKIAIQHGGRYKPLDTYARDIIKYITGSEHKEPLSNLLMLVCNKSTDDKLINVQSRELKEFLGLEVGETHFSLSDMQGVWQKLDEITKKASQKRNNTRLEKTALELYNKMALLNSLYDGSGLKVIPAPIGEGKYWPNMRDLESYLGNNLPSAPYFEAVKSALDKLPKEKLTEILTAYVSLKKSFTENNVSGFSQSSQYLYKLLAELNTSEYPKESELVRELGYNKLDPIGKAWKIYLIAFVFFILSVIIRKKVFYISSILITSVGLALHIYGMVLRWQVAGRQPWSNMYESMLLLCLGIVVLSLIFELIYRNKIFGIVSTLMSVVGLIFANNFTPFSQSINPLMPALKSNWMTIHTPCIMQGYVAGTIFMAIGHVFLFTYLIYPYKRDSLLILDDMMYRVLQVAVIFTLSGTCLGAVWGGEAWGRYWGWDMKENWALITLIGFLATLHCRIAGIIDELGTAIASILCFVLVILTYYGVNLVFGQGLHSYGFGAAEYTPIAVFFVFELILTAITIATYMARRKLA
ncbi:cytochrome c biogenesis protein CcsA [Candidatus Peregrinibacteria bacterium]|nr:cytochrome c biogenesis protein CcsA [Candidatus Peregrinibacteria bacterium]